MSRARVAVLKVETQQLTVTQADVTVIDLTIGEVLSQHQIDPDRGYWRNQNEEPGRWPSSQN